MVLEGESLCGMLRSGEQPPGRGPPVVYSAMGELRGKSALCNLSESSSEARCWHLPENCGEVSAVTYEPPCPARTPSAEFITQLGQTDADPSTAHTVPLSPPWDWTPFPPPFPE